MRVSSAVRANTKARALGLYDAAEGVEFAKLALDGSSRKTQPFGEMSGRDYFENYFYLARAEMNLGVEDGKRELVEKGLNTAIDGLQKIQDARDTDELHGRAPETGYYEGELNTLKGQAEKCLASSDWSACMSTELE